MESWTGLYVKLSVFRIDLSTEWLVGCQHSFQLAKAYSYLVNDYSINPTLYPTCTLCGLINVVGPILSLSMKLILGANFQN